MPAMRETARSGGKSRHRWLLLIPFLWQVGMVPFVNDVAWRPFSLPFAMVWQMIGILVTSLVIATVFTIDERLDPDEPDVPAARTIH